MTFARPRYGFGLFVLALALLAGCASTRVNALITLPPTTIVGDPHGARGDIYDAYTLFDRADRAFVEQEWETAIVNYRRILDEYPDSDVVALARYNLGLVYERLGQWADALTVYDSFPSPPGPGIRLEEVRMRRGVVLQRLKRYAQAQHEFELILTQFAVPSLEYDEAQARVGIAAFYAGDQVLAEHYLPPVLADYEQNAARGIHYARSTYAEGYFVMGEIAFARFREIPVEGDQSALADGIRRKAEEFVEARDYYTRAVRTYEPEWMIASMYRIGMGYELFYRAVMAVPPPPELDEAARAAYREQLAVKLAPVLDKALTAYRRNLELAADLRQDNQWVAKTRARYEKLGALAQRDP